MGRETILAFLFIVLVALLLGIYWFVPFNTTEFFSDSVNSNFSLDYNSTDMQFYENMRFPNPEISYTIYDCPLKKKNDMERAFEILEEITILDFYSVSSDGEISVNCDEKTKMEEGLFIAGEGGPTEIVKTNNFNVIFSGQVLLIRDSECPNPNVAIHELLHVLGFKHSENPNNIMYNLSKCKQTTGDDIPQLIDELYSVPSYADLSFENVSAFMHGRYLNANISIRNNGLKDSENAKIKIYADDKFVKESNLEPMKVGYGISLSLSNLIINQLNIKELDFEIVSDFEELDKENNKINLKIKED